MIKKLGLLLFGLLIISQGHAALNLTITGVKGKILKNIRTRLKESAATDHLLQPESLKQQIIKAMEPYGYFTPTISITFANRRYYVHIVANQPIVIDKLALTLIGQGANNPSLLQAIKQFPLQSGQLFNSVDYEQAKQNLLTVAENQGYLKAYFEKALITVDKAHHLAKVTLLLNTNSQYYFGQVQFDPTYIKPELLRRYVGFKAGQPYSTAKVLQLNNDLSASGYFKEVIVTPKLDNPREIPIVIHLQKVARINYSVGAGFGTDTGIRGRFGINVVPVNRQGHKFNAVALGSFRENALQAQYLIPGTNPITDDYSFNSSISSLNYNSGISNSLLLNVAQRHKLTNFERVLSLNALLDYFKYTNQPRQHKIAVFPKATFSWNNTYGQLFSPNGYNLTTNALWANRLWLSQVNFAQFLLDAKAAFTFKPLKTRFYFHALQGFTGIRSIDELPLSVALLLGGTDNLKGYSYNSIGPGKILTYAGIEIQKEVKNNWYFIGFFDSGDVYNPVPIQLQQDVGLGVMWVSPIGPLKIGLAEAVDNRFHFIHPKSPRIIIKIGPDL